MFQVQGREIPPDEVRTALTTDERAELERLRQENLALRTQPRPPRWRIRWRSVIATVLLVLGCALAPVALVAVWTRSEVSARAAAARPDPDDCGGDHQLRAGEGR
jgi:hypothetical protein